jgi:hypothetical protein
MKAESARPASAPELAPGIAHAAARLAHLVEQCPDACCVGVPLRVPLSISLHGGACSVVVVDGFPRGMSRIVFSEHQSNEHSPRQVGT